MVNSRYFLFLLTIILLSCTAKEKEIGLNEEILHSDFLYSVPGYFTMDSIFDGSQVFKPTGKYYIVKFKVQNASDRGNHNWNNSIAYITDVNGNTYENSEKLQKTLNRIEPFRFKPEHSTNPYETEVTYLVFDVPNTTQKPYLMIRGENLFWDFLDGSQLKKTKVRLF